MEKEEKIYPVSWDQFHRDCKSLAWRLADIGTWETLVTITRGGLSPSGIIARELNIRIIETICVSSYKVEENSGSHSARSAGELQILKPISPQILANSDGGRNVLVIDELTDSGNTLRALRGMLPNAHFATVYAKPAGKSAVDSYVTEVSQDTWIFLPWDLGLAFQKPLTKGGE